MRATRVEQLATNLPKGHRRCWRCGAVFRWADMHLVEGAPCRDCREALADEGDPTQWNDRTVAPAEADEPARDVEALAS